MDNIEKVSAEIEAMFQTMCHNARIGGAATIDEVADVLSLMCRLASIVKAMSKSMTGE